MSLPWDTVPPKTEEGQERLWTQARRQEALRAIEEQFNLRLTEEEVFRAATLFFSLLVDGALVNKAIIAQEVRRQLLLDAQEVLDAKKSVA